MVWNQPLANTPRYIFILYPYIHQYVHIHIHIYVHCSTPIPCIHLKTLSIDIQLATLRACTWQGDAELVLLLLRSGAEHLRSSASGQTAMDFAGSEEVRASSYSMSIE